MKVKWFIYLLFISICAAGVLAGGMDVKNATALARRSEKNPSEISEKIEAELIDKLTSGTNADFIIKFNEQADLTQAHSMSWERRGIFVYETLKEVAERTQTGAIQLLRDRDLRFQTFIAGNELYVWGGDLEIANAIAALVEVGSIRATKLYYIDPITAPTALLQKARWAVDLLTYRLYTTVEAEPDALAWGIDFTDADTFWSTFGDKGAGIKVANIDTGVQWNHPALDQAFACPGDPSNPACWADPSNICGGSACDNNGHGTHTMGTMVGDDDPALTWQAGMAPDASWIACKGCETNSCSDYALNTCADWLLAPDGNPANRPMVVNNSWGGGGCDSWYLAKVTAWRAAGIFPAFSAGNMGSGCTTLGSPGDYQESFASAAVDSGGTVASFSSRGPSCYGHDPYTKPNIAAPGVSICSAVPTNAWNCGYSGTSMASPHSAGAVALLWSCNPSLMGNIDVTFQLLQNNSTPPPAGNCGAPPDGQGNYTYGYGYLNVFLAGLEACSYTPPSADILLVDDDDNNPDVRGYYTDVLDLLGASYDIWDTGNSDNEPDSGSLENYNSVIWFTGHEYGGAAGPGSAGEAALATWLGGAASIVGEWELSYDWNCDGAPNQATIKFYPDGSFSTSEGESGTWTQSGSQVEWVFTNGTTYNGKINGDFMEGEMLSYSGTPGCWTATRIVTAGYVRVFPGELDASGEQVENPGLIQEFYVEPFPIELPAPTYVQRIPTEQKPHNLSDEGKSEPVVPETIVESGAIQESLLLDQKPNQGNGYFTDVGCDLCGGPQVLAENFEIDNTETIGQVFFWTGYYPGDVPIEPDAITVIFHKDAAGLPGSVVHSESNVAYQRIQTGVVLFGVHEYLHSLTLQYPAVLTPGNYWVEIYNNTGLGTDDFFWETGDLDTVGNGLPGSAYAYEAPGATWQTQSDELAIQLVRANANRCLLISSQDYLFDRGLTPFMQKYLGVGSYSNDIMQTIITGTGSVFSDLGVDLLTYPYYNYSDAVDPDGTAEVAFAGDNGNAGVDKFTSGYFTTFLGYPYEAIMQQDYRLALMQKFLDTCGTQPQYPDIDVTPPLLYSAQPPDEITSQELTIANLGTAPLDWVIQEYDTYAIYPYHPRQVDIPEGYSLSAEPSFAAQAQPEQMRRINAYPQMLVNDGSFENGPPPASAWTEWSSTGCEWIGDWSGPFGVPAFDGTYDFWAGGYCGTPNTNYVRQDISVPSSNAYLSFWYMAYRPDLDDPSSDFSYVNVGGSYVWLLEMIQANNTYPNYVNVVIDLSAWAGQDVTLEFGGVSTGDATGNVRFDYIEWPIPENCSAPVDIPWLEVAPGSGTTDPAASSSLQVSFNSSGYVPGYYDEANLCVFSNDPDEPLEIIPVTLEVTTPPADIEVIPNLLYNAQYSNEVVVQPLLINNLGGENLHWLIDESPRTIAVKQEPREQSALAGKNVEDTETNGVFIDNGLIQMGINSEGHANVPGGPPSAGEGTTWVGLRYMPTNMESLAPGNPCEGWGVADAISGHGGWANECQGGSMNITPTSFNTTPSTAVSIVTADSIFKVMHDFHPSPITPNLYEVTVVIQNISASSKDVLYRRVLDWDVEPTQYYEFVTIHGSSSNHYMLYASDNGFASADPLSGTSYLNFEWDAMDNGPTDHGALFDLRLGTLGSGQIISFTLFYGAAATEAQALTALIDVGAEVYSLGQVGSYEGATVGSPNTFIFALKGLGGTPLCDPGNIPWVTVNPIEGMTEPYSTSNVEVFFDSTGMAPGLYQGDLCIYSNDPDESLVVVPVEMEVMPPTSQATLRFEPQEEWVPVNGNVDVSMFIDNVENLYGIQTSAIFDPNLLEVVDADPITPGVQITPGSCPQADFVVTNSVDNSLGIINYAASSLNPTPPCNGDGPIATINFRGKVSGDSWVHYTFALLSDPNGYEIPIAGFNSGLVHVLENPIEGYVNLQSRGDESGAFVCALDTGIPIACTTTDATGYYILYVAGEVYDIQIEMERFLDAYKSGVTGGTFLSTVTLLGGDSNDSDDINILDISFIGARFLANCGDPLYDERADINNDCHINILDITVSAANFTKTSPVPWP